MYSHTPRACPPASPEGALDPWAEEPLDGSFLGSGEELDLLSEILDSLNTGVPGQGGLRTSQSLDCCHHGALEYCSSMVRICAISPNTTLAPHFPSEHCHVVTCTRPSFQPDIPGSPQWSQEDPPGPLSLPASLHPEAMLSWGHPISRSPPKGDQGPTGLSQPPSAPADLESSVSESEPLTLHLSPPRPGPRHLILAPPQRPLKPRFAKPCLEDTLQPRSLRRGDSLKRPPTMGTSPRPGVGPEWQSLRSVLKVEDGVGFGNRASPSTPIK